MIKDSINATNPDLIVLTGDNIGDSACNAYIRPLNKILVEKAIDEYMKIFERAGVPVAMVFGNHDSQYSNVTKEEQMEMYMKYDCFIGYDEGEEINGCGNYNVPIYSSNGEKIVYNLWMIDSGSYDEVNGGYDYIRQDQIDWYVQKSNELKAANGGVPVPSMAFQHIIVREIFDALKEVPEGTPGAVYKYDKYWVLDESNTKAGEMREGPCPSDTNSGEFQAMKEQGDVVAMFFGHDHVNTFEVTHQGIDLVSTPGVGFASYGGDNRGVRLITLNEKDIYNYDTEVITYFDFYGDDLVASLRFNTFANEIDFFVKVGSAIAYFLLKCMYKVVS